MPARNGTFVRLVRAVRAALAWYSRYTLVSRRALADASWVLLRVYVSSCRATMLRLAVWEDCSSVQFVATGGYAYPSSRLGRGARDGVWGDHWMYTSPVCQTCVRWEQMTKVKADGWVRRSVVCNVPVDLAPRNGAELGLFSV